MSAAAPAARSKAGAPAAKASADAPAATPRRAARRAKPKPGAGTDRIAHRDVPATDAVATPVAFDEPAADDLFELPPFIGLDPADADEPDPRDEPAEQGRRERRRERRRQAKRRKRGERERHEVSAARRAELVAAAAALAAAGPDHVASKAARPRRPRAIARLAVLVVVGLVAAAATALVMAREPITRLSSADAGFMSAQLVRADQRVRAQLALLSERGPAIALDRTRDALATTRSLTIETRGSDGRDAGALRRALTLEAAWLDAVGSVLSNPNSPLIGELGTRDEALRPALARLPTRPGSRTGGTQALVDYSRTRSAR